MAINLATKYSDKISEAFAAESYMTGRVSNNYEFTGVRGVKIYTPETVALTDYRRSGANRYGEPREMQDTVQELVMKRDRSFSLTIDKGNNAEQLNTKEAGRMLRLQIDERVVPEVDKYAFGVFAQSAGKIATIMAKPTKSNIVEEVGKADTHLTDNYVPERGRTLYVTAEVYNLIRLSPEFVGLESLGTKAIGKGQVGELFGASVVKVPTKHLPVNCFFLLCHKAALLAPNKISDSKVHQDPPGLSGHLMEGRWIYDAFVLGAKCHAVYALVLESAKQEAPKVTHASNAVTIAATGATRILYTTDGSDPRYFSEAETYGSPVSTAGWPAGKHTVKAVAYADGKFTSDVAELEVTKS